MSLSGPLVSYSHATVYHLDGPAFSLFGAVLLDIALLWAALTALFRWAEGSMQARNWVWCGIFVVLPYIVAKNLRSLTGSYAPRAETWLLLGVPLLSVLALTALRRGDGAWFAKLLALARSVLGACALYGLLLLGQLTWFGWQARHLNDLSKVRPVPATGAVEAGRGRVIWVLLDELSYQQVYEHRLPGLRLPAFDDWAETSTLFTHAIATANVTALAIPSLFTGVQVDDLDVSGGGLLIALHSPAEGWQRFDARQTVFQDARNYGYSTAIAGWYNPYCRVLIEVLDRCRWSSLEAYNGHMYAGAPIVQNAAGPFLGLLHSLWQALFAGSRNTTLDQKRSAMHVEDYRKLADAGDSDLEDASLRFVYLHMPVPHAPNIFDRRQDRFTTGSSSYADNLVLADHFLAHVRQTLERRGEWNAATVIVMGDHSWRVSAKSFRLPDWTAEDQLASHGGIFDDRPFYLVKLAGQTQGARIEAPFAAVRTRALLDAVFAGTFSTPAALEAWAETR